MTEVYAIVCGWRDATTIVRCERCQTPMVEQDRLLQYCPDCREWFATRPAAPPSKNREGRAHPGEAEGGQVSPEKAREEHMRTALILGRCSRMLDEALHGRATFEVREEAYDSLAQSRRRLQDLDKMLWPDSPLEEGPS